MVNMLKFQLTVKPDQSDQHIEVNNVIDYLGQFNGQRFRSKQAFTTNVMENQLNLYRNGELVKKGKDEYQVTCHFDFGQAYLGLLGAPE
jgi:hypothetical protein